MKKNSISATVIGPKKIAGSQEKIVEKITSILTKLNRGGVEHSVAIIAWSTIYS